MRLDPIFLHLYDVYGKQDGYPIRYSSLPRRRAAILSGIVGALVLACAAWLVAAQVGLENSELRSPSKQSAAATGKIDLNVAELNDLARLPGMTPQLAEQIIRSRPYRKLDDLITRKVLGKKQFAKIRYLVVVGRDKP